METNELSKYVHLPLGEDMPITAEIGTVPLSFINEPERPADADEKVADGAASTGDGDNVGMNFLPSFATAPLWMPAVEGTLPLSGNEWHSELSLQDSQAGDLSKEGAKSALINPEAADSQYLIELSPLDAPSASSSSTTNSTSAVNQSSTTSQPSTAAHHHSYGTRFATRRRDLTQGPPQEPQTVQTQAQEQEEAQSSPEAKKKVLKKEKVYCICRQPDDHSVMIQCDMCKDWFHIACVGLSKLEAEKLEKFVCPVCAKGGVIEKVPDHENAEIPLVIVGKEAKSIDPKVLLTNKEQSEKPSVPSKPIKPTKKCLRADCANSARESNDYCSDECLVKDCDNLLARDLALTGLKGSQKPTQPADTKARPPAKLAQIKSPKLERKSAPSAAGGVQLSAGQTERVRNNVANSFAELFKPVFVELRQKGELANMNESPETHAEKLAKDVEQAMFDHFATKNSKGASECDQPYKSKFRSLVTNLKDKKNEQLRMQVIKGEIMPIKLVNMSSEDLANPELKSMTEKIRRESIHKSVLQAPVHEPRIKKTHKGEFIIIEGRSSPTPDVAKEDERKRRDDAKPTISPTNTTFNSGVTVAKPDVTLGEFIARMSATRRSGSTESQSASSEGKLDMATVNSPLPMSPVALDLSPMEMASPATTPPRAATPSPPGSPKRKFLPDAPVWTGKVVHEKARFSAKATLVAARTLASRDWSTIIAPMLAVSGRIQIEEASKYLSQQGCSTTKEVVVVQIDPLQEDDNQEQFNKFCEHLRERKRFGVVQSHEPVKDMYLVPLAPTAEIPEFVQILEYDEVPENRSADVLLGVIVIIKTQSSKRKPAVHLSSGFPKREKTDASVALAESSSSTSVSQARSATDVSAPASSSLQLSSSNVTSSPTGIAPELLPIFGQAPTVAPGGPPRPSFFPAPPVQPTPSEPQQPPHQLPPFGSGGLVFGQPQRAPPQQGPPLAIEPQQPPPPVQMPPPQHSQIFQAGFPPAAAPPPPPPGNQQPPPFQPVQRPPGPPAPFQQGLSPFGQFYPPPNHQPGSQGPPPPPGALPSHGPPPSHGAPPHGPPPHGPPLTGPPAQQPHRDQQVVSPASFPRAQEGAPPWEPGNAAPWVHGDRPPWEHEARPRDHGERPPWDHDKRQKWHKDGKHEDNWGDKRAGWNDKRGWGDDRRGGGWDDKRKSRWTEDKRKSRWGGDDKRPGWPDDKRDQNQELGQNWGEMNPDPGAGLSDDRRGNGWSEVQQSDPNAAAWVEERRTGGWDKQPTANWAEDKTKLPWERGHRRESPPSSDYRSMGQFRPYQQPPPGVRRDFRRRPENSRGRRGVRGTDRAREDEWSERERIETNGDHPEHERERMAVFPRRRWD